MPTIPQLPPPDLAHGRSNAILRLVIRNQIATNAAIHRLVLPEVASATAQKIIVRLIRRGLLTRWPLHSSKSYLRLGPSAIARWQYPESLSRRLGPQVLPYLLGCLTLSTYSSPPIKRLLPRELENLFALPDTREIQQWAYYRDRSNGTDQLATVRVEYRVGGDAVINKVAEQLHRYRQYPSVNQLLDENRFIVHVVTATAEQEKSLWEAAERLAFPAQLLTSHDPGLTCFL